MIVTNPLQPQPDTFIVPVSVDYIDFNGTLQHGTIEVNREVVSDIQAFFDLAISLHFPIERIVRSSDPDFSGDDDKLMAANASSGFNKRFIKGTTQPSLHSFGLAFDINCRLNPYICFTASGESEIYPPGAHYDQTKPGTLYANHPLVTLMKGRGWEWGGDWSVASGRVDYQHFQKPLLPYLSNL